MLGEGTKICEDLLKQNDLDLSKGSRAAIFINLWPEKNHPKPLPCQFDNNRLEEHLEFLFQRKGLISFLTKKSEYFLLLRELERPDQCWSCCTESMVTISHCRPTLASSDRLICGTVLTTVDPVLNALDI